MAGVKKELCNSVLMSFRGDLSNANCGPMNAIIAASAALDNQMSLLSDARLADKKDLQVSRPLTRLYRRTRADWLCPYTSDSQSENCIGLCE